METLRKIELQEPEDLIYLIQNVRAEATAQLNEAFPPVEDQDGRGDELRLRIEKEVHEYINRTFHLALPNLTINGLDIEETQFLPPLRSSKDLLEQPQDPLAVDAASEPIVVFEPFDNSKRTRVEALCREEEDLLREISALKRKVPASAASRFSTSASERLRIDDELLSSYLSNAIQAVASSATPASPPHDGAAAAGRSERSTVNVKLLSRQADTEHAFESAVNGLSHLTKEMPATVAKMDRARAAGEYVSGKK